MPTRPQAGAAPWWLSAPRAPQPSPRCSSSSLPAHEPHRLAARPSLTSLTAATLLPLLAVLVLVGHPRAAAAQSAQVAAPSALVVFGRADQSMQDVVYAVVDRKLRDAGWPLVPQLASNDATIVRGCLSKPAPWPCLESMASKKGIERIVAVRVEIERSPDGTSQVVLTGRLIYAGAPAKIEQKRYCGACSTEDLTAYGEEISKELLAERALLSGNTKIAVSSTPMGAEVRIDNKPVGVTNNVFATSPGKHTVEVRAPGHESEIREVSVNEGKTATVNFPLRRGQSPTTPPGPPLAAAPTAGPSSGSADVNVDVDGGGDSSPLPAWAPKAMVGVGGSLVVTGVVLLIMDEGPTEKMPGAPKTYRETQTGGIVALISGAVIGGAGGYLWWKNRSRTVVPTTSMTSGSVTVGVSGAF